MVLKWWDVYIQDTCITVVSLLADPKIEGLLE